MDKKRIILLSLLLGLAIALLGLLLLMMGRSGRETPAVAESAPTAAPTAVPTALPTSVPTEDPRLQLSSRPVDRDVKELAVASVTEEDLALIRQELPGLTLLDGRSCENGALLHAFSETVDYTVLWTVALGDARVDGDVEELIVPQSVTTAAEILTAMEDLIKVRTVDLRQSSLSNEEVMALRAAKPELSYMYMVNVQGTRDEANTKVLELRAEDITDWTSLALEISLLPDLEKIVVTGPMTAEHVAYLLEGAGSVPVTYSVELLGKTIGSEEIEVDFSDLPASELSAIRSTLAVLPNVKKVNMDPKSGESAWTLEEVDQIQTVREGLVVNYTTEAFGVTFSLADEAVSFSGKNLKKSVEDLRNLLPYMRNVKRVDMENCSIDNETMAALRDEFPQTKLVWRVKVGAYSVRTDAWMIKFSAGGRRDLSDKDTANLKYCREMKYLDLGHNSIHHMEFVSYMPDLEVCIMYDPISSLRGIEACSKLEYFECFSCGLKDLTPLAACTELKHLNVCYNNLKDITPLYGLTKLERLWISRNDGIPKEQLEKFKELVPDCVVNTTVHNPTGDGWRQNEDKSYVPRYALLREQFRYGNTELRSYGDGWWDDKTVHFGEMPAL